MSQLSTSENTPALQPSSDSVTFAPRKKILIIRFSSIGDIVLTTPVIRCIHEQVPGAEIHFLSKYAFHAVLENNPYIHKRYYLQHSWELLIHQLRDEQYDFIIDLHHNLRSLRIKNALGNIPHSAFHKLNWEKWLLTAFKINRLPDLHIVDRYLATAAPLGVVNDGRGLDYFISDAHHVQPADLPVAQLSGYIAVVIGAAHATKQLPLEKLQQLCALIPHPLVLLGGKEDRAMGDAIAAVDPIKIYNAAGKFSLNESADLVRRAKLVITHDTGLMHIAAAFKKKIISIWGNTVPAFGMTPYYGDHAIANRIFQVDGLSCRPCSKIGHKKCPKGHFKCMQLLDMQAIAAAAMELID